MPEQRVRLYVRHGCHLCDDAARVVDQVCTERSVGYALVDIDADERLRAEHTDHVPVTEVDGRVVARWFLDADRLAAALA